MRGQVQWLCWVPRSLRQRSVAPRWAGGGQGCTSSLACLAGVMCRPAVPTGSGDASHHGRFIRGDLSPVLISLHVATRRWSWIRSLMPLQPS